MYKHLRLLYLENII